MRQIQIGVIGSCSDINATDEAEAFATKLGQAIAKSGNVLMFGAEKDINSLPTVAALAAREAGGTTVGITYEKGLKTFEDKASSIVIASALVRGGGRETALILSCDVVIAIAGGSGTLTEITVAYQASIPVITVTGYGGWSDKLAGTFLDERKRSKFIAASSPEMALESALSVLKES